MAEPLGDAGKGGRSAGLSISYLGRAKQSNALDVPRGSRTLPVEPLETASCLDACKCRTLADDLSLALRPGLDKLRAFGNVTTSDGMSPEELKAAIGQYDALIIRSASKVHVA